MRDPGLQYLYDTPASGQQHRSPQRPSGERSLTMEPLPQPVTAGTRDWGPSLGNLESAKLALDTLRGLIQDAVFLDEDAYTNATTLQLYQQRIQVRSMVVLYKVVKQASQSMHLGSSGCACPCAKQRHWSKMTDRYQPIWHGRSFNISCPIRQYLV